MSEKIKSIDVGELGKMVGAPVSMKKFGDREMEAIEWSREYEEAAIEALKTAASDGSHIQLVGHLGKWAMCAACHALAETGISTFIPRMEVDVPLKAFDIGEPDSAISDFNIKENESGDIYIDFSFTELPPQELHKITAPVLPERRNIFIRAVGHPLLQSICLALAYAAECTSVWLSPSEKDDCFFCGVSNTPEFSVGDERTVVF